MTTAAVGRTVLPALAAQQLLMAYDSTAMNVALSDIVRDLGTTTTGVQSAISLYALVMACLMIPGSKLGVRYGHARVFAAGAAIYGSGAVVTALSQNLTMMIIGWSVLEGVGAALVMPAALALPTQLYRGAERTKALSAIAAAMGIGAGLGPVVGGLITTFSTWRVSFLMETAVTAVVIVLIHRAALPIEKSAAGPFDLIGVALSVLGLGLVVVGTLLAGRYGLLAVQTLVLVGSGVVVLAGFGWWETRLARRGRDPLVHVDVLRDRTIRAGSIGISVQYLATAGLLFLVPLFVQTTLNYDALDSGVTMLPTVLMLILAAAVSAKLVASGRLTRRTVLVAGLALLGVGCVLLAVFFTPDGTGWTLAPALALAGLGIGACSLFPDLLQSTAPPDRASDVAGLTRSVQNLGQSLGVALSGAVLLGVLLSTLLSGVTASQVLDAAQKSDVTHSLETDVQLAAVSDGQVRESLSAKGIAPAEVDELVRINAEARVRGLRAAGLTIGVIALAGVFVCLRLPRKVTR